MNKTIIPMIAAMMLSFGLQVGAENKVKPSTKEKPELITLEITGKLTKKESEGKNERVYTYYYLETKGGEKIRLNKTALPKIKKDKNGNKTEALTFDKFVDSNVDIKGKGYVKELKSKQKRTYLRLIDSIKKAEI